MKGTFVIALIGLLTTSSVSAQTGAWTETTSDFDIEYLD